MVADNDELHLHAAPLEADGVVEIELTLVICPISLVDTTILPFDEWTEVLGSERLTGALLDRLTHHVNILEMNDDSCRLNQR